MLNNHSCFINAAGNYTFQNVAGTVLSVVVGQAGGTSSALTLYDSQSGATPTCSTIAVISGGCVGTHYLECDFQRGLQGNLAGAPAPSIAVIVG